MIVAAERVDSLTTQFTVETKQDCDVTLRDTVSVIGFKGWDQQRLKDLYLYLVDRPSLMDDFEVKEGVSALKCIIGV